MASAQAQPVTDADIAVAKRVLRTEAAGLAALEACIDARFVDACDLIARVEGRLIVTGMGKSGHVARKIAATFASTGTPAQFVHPGEASHGDLGMITAADAILAISNSGETRELGDILEYARRFSIPLIAITARADSVLARHCDVLLGLPDAREAASAVLAPTTSTTMTLALGDALAVAMLERRGFTASDFRTFHPGGKLGQSLIRARDVMHAGEELPLAAPADTMDRVILRITEKRFGCAGLTDAQGRLIGIVTDGDLRRHIDDAGLMGLPAERVMTPDPVTVAPDALAVEVMGLLDRRKISVVFVVDERRRPVGIVHLHDLLRAGVR